MLFAVHIHDPEEPAMTVTPVTDTAPKPSPFNDFWLPDYCPRCNPAGQHADRCVRLATQAEPDAVIWHGGRGLVCEYFCERCGHRWTRTDLWTAKSAGISPLKRGSAA